MSETLPLIKKYPRYCCDLCGKPVGHLGRLISSLIGITAHNCDMSNVDWEEIARGLKPELFQPDRQVDREAFIERLRKESMDLMRGIF